MIARLIPSRAKALPGLIGRLSVGFVGLAICAPVSAQEQTDGEDVAAFSQPYIEVNQVLTAELSPGDDVLTFTQIATGIDTTVQGRNSVASVSVRYERNIGYGDAVDTDTLSGIARGSLAVVPQALTFEAGALATRTRIDGSGGVSNNPLISEDASSEIYSFYAGPSLTTKAGALDVSASAFVGYNTIEANEAIVNPIGEPIDLFDESVTYVGQTRVSNQPGRGLPIGLGIGARALQEDVSNLDQRVRDVSVRGDVTIPVSDSFALVGGVGYEDVEVSSRDALRDENGIPVLGDNGRFVTDENGPRQIAFDVEGLIWDVGVLWQPSRRTSLAATVGRRYDSTTYFGAFSYVPNQRSAVAINVYDGITSFGGALSNSLSGLSADFSAVRNALTGDFTGLVNGEDGATGFGNLGSVRSTASRTRGGNISYQRRIGGLDAALAAGYNQRTFIAAEGTILEDLDGLRDESYSVSASLASAVGQTGSLSATTYINWFTSEASNSDLTAYGASTSYTQALTAGLSARAAFAIDYFESDFSDEDFAAASALVGLRLDF